MAFQDFLIHRVEVRRRSGTFDRFGQPEDINPSQTGSDDVVGTYACRLDPGSNGLTNEERSRDVYELEHMLYVSVGADILEDDTIVVTFNGETLLPPARVKVKNTSFDAVGAHHLEIKACVQRGPQ